MRATGRRTSGSRRWRRPVAANRVWLVAATTFGIAVAPLPLSSARPAERRVRIEASMAGFTPAAIAVNRGDRVTVELVATDVVHGLHLDGYGLSVMADPGQPAALTFVADRPGTFRFRCSVTCGPLHPFLVGKLRVGSSSLLWRAAAIAALIVAATAWPVRR